MSKGNSGLFHGTLGTTKINSTVNSVSYSDRGIELPVHIKDALSKLKKRGDSISGTAGAFSMKDVSIMSKETGVEFAHITIGEKVYLIRGDKNGAVIPKSLREKMVSNGGTLDFHSHPHDNDCIPSGADRKMICLLKAKTGQSSSQIVTPNGRITVFNETGVVETKVVSNLIDSEMQQIYLRLFGGK